MNLPDFINKLKVATGDEVIDLVEMLQAGKVSGLPISPLDTMSREYFEQMQPFGVAVDNGSVAAVGGKTMVQAEYEAHWDCPECENLTTKADDEHIAYDNGDVLGIKCMHDVDIGYVSFVKCHHEYQVKLST